MIIIQRDGSLETGGCCSLRKTARVIKPAMAFKRFASYKGRERI
jgi:hypothetical protein